MDILGTVNMEVKFNRMKPIVHEFKVLNTRTYSNVLIGQDLMKMFGTVKFDFTKNQVQLGNIWHNGTTLNGKEQVHIKERTIIPARSEQTVLVKCTSKAAMLSVDFEPRQVPGVRGMFSSRDRVTPNMDGVFQITMINVTESDITLRAGKIIGLNHVMDESIACVGCSTISDNDPNNLQPHFSNIQFGKNLTAEQKETAQNLINQYADAPGKFVTSDPDLKR